MPEAAIDLAPFRVSICGLGEMAEHEGAGITHLVSILDPDWPVPTACAAIVPPRRAEFRFHDIIDPVPGHVPPRIGDVEKLLAFGRTIEAGAHVLVHCHAGQSRSTAAAVVLLSQACPALSPEAAFAAVLRMRARAWPNLRILEFGDALLQRRGAIIAAAGNCYRQGLDRDPLLMQALLDGGRGREITAALGR